MRVYFSGSIAGGRKYLHTYIRIVSHLKEKGHTVPTEHVARPGVLELEKKLSPDEIFERDMLWLKECDVIIAEVSHPSLGVGYEICEALHLGRPTLCLHHSGLFISRIITGNTRQGLLVRNYSSTDQLFEHIDEFLRMHGAEG